MSALKEIGLLPKVNKYNDQSDTVFLSKRDYMRLVDLIPVYFAIDLANLFEDKNEAKRVVTVDYEMGIKEYQQKLEQIGADTTINGIRAWVTGESSAQEEITNHHKPNKFVEMYDQMIETGRRSSDIIKSTGKRFFQETSDFSIGSSALAIATDGRQLSLPKIWQNSDYTSGLNLSIRLISPYGHKESFKKHIAEPLLYLMALVSPSSYDGITYGLPPFIYIRGYGNAYMPLAIPKSLGIIRNGGEGHINKYKQPLDITVSMSFEHALPGFGALIVNHSGVKLNDVTTSVNDDKTYIKTTSKMSGISNLSSVIESLRPYEFAANSDIGSVLPLDEARNFIVDSIGETVSTNIKIPSNNFTNPTNINLGWD